MSGGLLGDLPQRGGQRVGSGGELLFRQCRAGTVARAYLRVPLLAAPRQVLRLLTQVGQIAFEGRPAEELAAALQRLAQLLLRLGQLLQGFLGAFRIQILEGLLEAGQLLP